MKDISEIDAKVLASIPRIDSLDVHEIRRGLPINHADVLKYLKAEAPKKGYPDELRYYYRQDKYGVHIALICHSHHHIILLDKKDFECLPKLHWDVVVTSNGGVDVQAICDGRYVSIVKALKVIWKVDSKKRIYPLGHVFDFRRSRRTMSNLTNNVGDGRMGVYFSKGKWIAYECISSRRRRNLYHGPSRLDAQQAFNAFLLKYKRNNPSDMHLFGTYYVNGIRQPLFPVDHYNTQGKLLRTHFKIFKQHKVYVRECVNVLSMLDLTPLNDDPVITK